MLRTCEGKYNFELATAFHLTKSFIQIELPISLHTFAPFSELPSDIMPCKGLLVVQSKVFKNNSSVSITRNTN